MLKIFELNLKFEAACFSGNKSNRKLIPFTLILYVQTFKKQASPPPSVLRMKPSFWGCAAS
jgi:hypothetical protein